MDKTLEMLTKREPYKRSIDPEPHISKPIYDHLRPVLNYALDKGCRFVGTTHSRPFSSTRNGEYCQMEGPVKMSELQEAFDFPESFEFRSDHQQILWDKRNNITLVISTKL